MRNISPISILTSAQARAWFPKSTSRAVNSLKWLAGKVPATRGLYHGARNWYEAGWPLWSNGNFSYVPSLVQDARWDQNFVTRREMLRRMRYWSQNSAIVEALLSIGERYTVGSAGLHVAFYPSDDNEDAENDWYDRAEMVCREWMQGACGWNDETFDQLLKIGYRCQKVDGEIFYIKTFRKMPLAVGNRILQVNKPCLQMVEAHRCESPWNKFANEGDTLVDGVQFESYVGSGLNKYRKLGYWMRSGISQFEQWDSWEMVPVGDLFHIFTPHRVNQWRGISDFYSIGQLINKLEDILEIEMKAQSTQSKFAVGITNNAGAANVLEKKFEGLKALGVRAFNPPNQETKPDTERAQLFEKVYNAITFWMKNGEDIKFHSPNRPSEQSVLLFEFLINEICAGSKIPRCLVLQKISSNSARGQGTEIRAELDNADLYFNSDFQKWMRFTKDSVTWFMEWAIQNDSRVFDPPANWRNCLHIMQPESCNVDVGYTTQANATMLAAGVIDYEKWCAPMGMSAMQVFRRLKRQQDWLRKNNVQVSLPAILKGEIPLASNPQQEQQEVARA